MESVMAGAVAALWLGFMTAISPCPLVTNIAAVSYLGGRASDTGYVFLAGMAYSLGRMAVYSIMGILAVSGLMSISFVSMFLQRYGLMIVGPLLIIIGMMLLDLVTLPIPDIIDGDTMNSIAAGGGIKGAFLMGFFFALSFCPVSAALFFGSLIPISIKYDSRIVLPSLYGLGTGLPVMVTAFLLSTGTRAIGVMFNRLTRIEFWMRRLTGGLFVLVGLYVSLKYIYGIL